MKSNIYSGGLDDEQLGRYNYAKSLILNAQPSFASDKIQMELTEMLSRYYGLKGEFPEPFETETDVKINNLSIS
jgi:hypothetical protein